MTTKPSPGLAASGPNGPAVRPSGVVPSAVAPRSHRAAAHPLVVTVHRRSPPRVAFAGDRLVEIDLPEGSRVVYPRPPIEPLKDPDAAIRYALNRPIDSGPLYAKLRPGMKVVVAIDDAAVPLPPMRGPDARERVLTIVLQMLADSGVEDVEMIIATSLRRRMTAPEVRRMLGERIFDAYWPDRLYSHDAEDPQGMKLVGTTDRGEVVELNRRAVEADLLIYVSLNFVPIAGGETSVAVGLSGYRSLRAHHTPHVVRRNRPYTEPAASAVATSVDRMARVVEEALDVFHIGTTIGNRTHRPPLGFLSKNEDDWTGAERAAYRALSCTLPRAPRAAREALFARIAAPYGMTGVFAGEYEAVRARTAERALAQYLVPLGGQADVLVCGVSCVSPYHASAFLNPLLVQVMAQGHLFNMHRGAPAVRRGGAMIVFHPCSDRFDPTQHAPHVEFVHDVLPQTRDAMVMHTRFEEKFANNPAYLAMYRRGHAYHPAHPFFQWYAGEAGRQHLGRVVVVGADNDCIPKLLGWQRARDFTEALVMASGGNRAPQVTMLHVPPFVVPDMTGAAGW